MVALRILLKYKEIIYENKTTTTTSFKLGEDSYQIGR